MSHSHLNNWFSDCSSSMEFEIGATDADQTLGTYAIYYFPFQYSYLCFILFLEMLMSDTISSTCFICYCVFFYTRALVSI